MTLLTALRADLPKLMKRRDTVALRSVRDAIAAIENAEISYVAEPALVAEPSEFVAGGVKFGHAERIVTELSPSEMMALARAQVDSRLEDAARYRAAGQIDRALTLKAEALALSDRLDTHHPH
ncbi:MAG: hypothetical protein WAL91_08430 [Propionicimonas sp.]